MKIVRCPDTSFAGIQPPLSLFIAGGITGCFDWQERFLALLGDNIDNSLSAFNPRRISFDVSDPTAAKHQIAWEYDHLSAATAISFWFPRETLCPITLFELGRWAASDKQIFVGCHPDYQRRIDVVEQLRHLRPSITVRSTLYELVDDVVDWHVAALRQVQQGRRP